MQLENQPICNVCEMHHTQFMAKLHSEIDGQDYDAVKCNNCGLIFVHPLPDLSFDNLQDVYGVNYTEGMRDTISKDQYLRQAVNRQMEFVEKYCRRGVALNVGAMSGEIQVLEERGWKLHIVDVSSYAAKTARENWGFNVVVSKIEDFDCPPETFDFIKLGHVIEHLANPKLALEKLTTLLKTDGIILIDTDNAHGLKTQVEVTVRKLLGEDLSIYLARKLSNKNLNKRYGRLLPPEHLYNFSPMSLQKLLEDAGYEIIKVLKPAWGDQTWFPLSNFSNYSRVEKIFIRIDQIGARFGFGDVIVVLARKR